MEDSVDSSGLAARDSMEQEETSTLMARESEPTEWTDEKHSLFLKSMESTFVNQLYKSIDLFSLHTRNNGPSESRTSTYKKTGNRAVSGQFKVLRDGCWSKIGFTRDDEPQVQEEPKAPLANPWIKRYRNTNVQTIRKFPTSHSKASLAATENRNPANNFRLWCKASTDNSKEETDQNFNDEVPEEEKSRRTQDMKRTRTTTDHHIVSSNDQQVITSFF